MKWNKLRWIVNKSTILWSQNPITPEGGFSTSANIQQKNAVIILFWLTLSTIIWLAVFSVQAGCAFMICACHDYTYTQKILIAKAREQCHEQKFLRAVYKCIIDVAHSINLWSQLFCKTPKGSHQKKCWECNTENFSSMCVKWRNIMIIWPIKLDQLSCKGFVQCLALALIFVYSYRNCLILQPPCPVK